MYLISQSARWKFDFAAATATAAVAIGVVAAVATAAVAAAMPPIHPLSTQNSIAITDTLLRRPHTQHSRRHALSHVSGKEEHRELPEDSGCRQMANVLQLD